jgi:ribosome-binding factor A
MVCETRLRPRQTLTERKRQVRELVSKIAADLASGRVKVVVDRRTGAIAFSGISDRRDVTDACVYRQIMAGTNMSAKLAIAKAEQLAGRAVDRQVVSHGVHSHDGGQTWHGGHRR